MNVNDIIGLAGMALAAPAYVAYWATGESRLLRFNAAVEQKIIDYAIPAVSASVLGWGMAVVSMILEGPAWVAALVGVSSVGTVTLQIIQARTAQWNLDCRQADSAGMFYCRDCVEVHHLDAGCYADEGSEEAHG